MTDPGEPRQHMLNHMYDDCPKWPYATSAQGYGIIRVQGRNKVVSREVCEIAHGPPPTPEHQAAHNCGKGNLGCFGANCLQWKTRAENRSDELIHGTRPRGERHGLAKLTETNVREIRRLKGKLSQPGIASIYGVSRQTVGEIHRGEIWAWMA